MRIYRTEKNSDNQIMSPKIVEAARAAKLYIFHWMGRSVGIGFHATPNSSIQWDKVNAVSKLRMDDETLRLNCQRLGDFHPVRGICRPEIEILQQ